MNEILLRIVLLILPILAAVTVHELAHGYVAYRLGDPTAKKMGRLTLNPFKHLDLLGALVFFLTQAIGWAKPIPVDPRYFRNPRQGMIWVSLAGPGANLLLAVALAAVLRLGPVIYGLFSAVSAPLAAAILKPLFLMAYLAVQINIGLAVFNLLPVPPLDGSKILYGLLPFNLARRYAYLEPVGFVIILALVFTGIIDKIILPPIIWLSALLLGSQIQI
ncbi:site-2 protease family protein [Thermosulfuriphilus sp.]